MTELILPDLVLLEEYGGDFNSYNEAVYEVFRNDFLISLLSFNGTKLRLKKHPYVDGKEYTYNEIKNMWLSSQIQTPLRHPYTDEDREKITTTI